ncbi:eukaryotic translation initiation factor 3 subunit J isoform X2 [Lutzomyia longipalpis]|uniref:eukaryotic translation initiation factor 3 subunit J isoform X2 n=1 Tax=Lutzomyia longipalpis TaxID=7200 RepID=UPI002483C1D8|nr:eukaryotic translation initiation factor 3 subunit J isoform X2 [Lutzomyia longipalpis]
MDDDWEQIADKIEQGTIPPKNPNINKWEGEDEDDDVKDNWEDDEEKKDEEKVEAKPLPKPKKTLQKKIAEKERLEEEELERREQEKYEAMTPEEQLAEKLRIEKAQKESDLKNAQDLLGVSGERLSSGEGIDAMVPTNKAEFTELADAISRKVSTFKAKDEFPAFIEELVRNMCVHLNSTDLKKVKTTVDNLYTEKQKMEKEKSKKGKAKSRAKLRYDGDTQSKITDYGYEEYDEYDDFM